MGVLHHPRRRHVALTLAAVAILVLASASAIRSNPTQHYYDIRVASGSKENKEEQQHITAAPRRRLSGPGSWPPSCRFKCGWCSPCKPVHVTIHPGLKVPLEYYPEAWRCKCGNTLFMP